MNIELDKTYRPHPSYDEHDPTLYRATGTGPVGAVFDVTDWRGDVRTTRLTHEEIDDLRLVAI